MEEKILALLKQQDVSQSGESLGAKLGVSRSAVWKGIESLRKQGYQIEAVPNRGYRLVDKGDVISATEIQEGLQTKELGRQVICLEQVDSTNRYLRDLAAKDTAQGLLVVAQEQVGGKGRLGRTWSSPKDTGIWMSLLLRPPLHPSQAPLLTLLAGVAVCRTLRVETQLPVQLKWPNDILLSGKKVCGILAEMTGELDLINSVVLGIGINVNQDGFPDELSSVATSFYLESGKKWRRAPLIQGVLHNLEELYQGYLAQGFSSFSKEYESYCVTLGKEVHVIGKDRFFGKALAITPQGELLVEKEDGSQIVVYSGEVSIRDKQ